MHSIAYRKPPWLHSVSYSPLQLTAEADVALVFAQNFIYL